MRPISLKIQGINSYREEQTIDFNELTSCGLFGIFGPTGSGKSTILDAITLALYARLPRSTKNYININEKKATVSFTFSIRTEELKTYRVDRTFRYRGKEGAQTVNNTNARLVDLSGGEPEVLSDLPTEVTALCISLLGLTSDDFMRTVVLPQGQFSEFLKLKNRERRGMLQRIFHLEKYGEDLNRKINSARIRQEIAISNLEGELKSYADASKEEIRKTEDQLTLLKESYQKSSDQQNVLSALFEEKNTVRTLLNEYEPLVESHNALILKKPNIEEESKKLEIARKANQLKPLADQARRAAQEHLESQAALSLAEEKLSTQQNTNDKFRSHREAFLSGYGDSLSALMERSQQLQSALSLSRSIQDYRKKSESLAAIIQKNEKKKVTLNQQREALAQQESQEKEAILTTEKELTANLIDPDHKTALEEGHILEENYREKRKHYEQKKQACDRDAGRAREADRKQKETLQEALALQGKGQELLHALEEQAAGLDGSIQELTSQMNENESLMEDYRKEHMAAYLRSSLKEGDICPVCGNVHHASLDSEEAGHSSHLEIADNHMGSSSKSEDTLNPKGSFEDSTFIKEGEKKRKQLHKKEMDLQKKLTGLNQSITSLEAELSALSLLTGEADKENSEVQTAASVLDGQSSKAILKALNPEKLMQELRDIRERYSTGQGTLEAFTATYQRSSGELKDEHVRLSEALNQIYDLRGKLKVDSCSQELKKLRQLEAREKELRGQVQNKRLSLEKLTSEHRKLLETIAETDRAAEGAIRERDSYESFIKEQQERFPQGISPDEDHGALLKQTEKEIAALEEEKNRIEKEFRELETQNQQLREEATAQRSRQAQAAQHAQAAAKLLKQQKSTLGFEEDFSPEQWIQTQEAIEQKEKTIEEFKKALIETEEKLKYFEEKLAGRSCSQEEWQEAKDQLDQIVKQNEDCREQITICIHRKETLNERYAVRLKLEKDLQSARHRFDRITLLSKLFKGNTFIEYMAESRLSYIAIEASHILSDISGGDYTLEVNESSEFVIRDNKNGGNIRPCDTLSGGETFVTSLALALSLSSAIQLNGTAPLELFFLDEGFGSLDTDLLEVVMTSLEHLQSRKRSIGIITHVEAIRSRVPVKLTVIPADEGKGGSRVEMEYS